MVKGVYQYTEQRLLHQGLLVLTRHTNKSFHVQMKRLHLSFMGNKPVLQRCSSDQHQVSKILRTAH